MTTPSIDLEEVEAAVHHMEDKNLVTASTDVMLYSNSGSNVKITLDDNNEINDTNRTHLTGQETWNIIFCFLAWACNVSIVTLGTFNLINLTRILHLTH